MENKSKWICHFGLISVLWIAYPQASVYAQALTLDKAWHQVENNNPSIEAARASFGAAEGQKIQASLIPNPVLNITQGSIPGLGEYSQNPNADSMYVINQLIETGGKRGARKSVAEAQYQETQVAYHANNTELFGITVQSFLSVAEAEAKLHLSKRGLLLNEETISTINQRVNAGRASALDLQAAQIALSDQRLAIASYESELSSSQFSLARLWNGSEGDVRKITMQPLKNMPLYPLSFYLEKTKSNWDLKSAAQAEKVAKAQIQLVEAKKYPDVTVGVGVQHFYQSSSPKSHNAVIAELAVPIPVFDRNQGNAVTASENYRRSLNNSLNKEISLQTNLVKTYQIASQARLQIDTLKKIILPQSLRTLALAKQGYEQGRFSYLDLLNAQQRLLDAEMREVTARFMYYRAWYVLQISTAILPQGNNA